MSEERLELLCLFCGRECQRLWWTRPVGHPVTIGQPLLPEVRDDGIYAHALGAGEAALEVRPQRGRRDRFIEVWTGSWTYYGTKDAPFCRRRCAESYAVEAARTFARMGKRLVFKHEATKP